MDGTHLLETWNIHNRINLYLLDAVDTAALGSYSASRGRSVGEQFAHLHNVRLMWLKAAAPDLLKGLGKIEKDCGPDKKLLRQSLVDSGAAIKRLLAKSIEAGGKVKGAGILQKEWALLWEKQLVRRQVELLLIQIGVREISIYREIGHQIRAQPILDIDAARMQRLRIAAFPQTGISRSTYGFKMKSLPLPMSPMPASARYSETLVIPNVLR